VAILRAAESSHAQKFLKCDISELTLDKTLIFYIGITIETTKVVK